MARGRVIGKDNGLPWHIPEDLRHFKRLTFGKPIVMGRRTFESIGRPLPGRQNIVVSRRGAGLAASSAISSALTAADTSCDWVDSLDAALRIARGDEIMVIGGASVYAQALPRCQRIYLTCLDTQVDGDTFFPEFDPQAWQVVERQLHAAGSLAPYAVTFKTLCRIASSCEPARD
ncbi:MAG: dihydrofolate reductase [Gammaproteobacteria bacterium]|nr:dihydrofolate reductase [Gammaproteobacteria bacterium]